MCPNASTQEHSQAGWVCAGMQPFGVGNLINWYCSMLRDQQDRQLLAGAHKCIHLHIQCKLLLCWLYPHNLQSGCCPCQLCCPWTSTWAESVLPNRHFRELCKGEGLCLGKTCTVSNYSSILTRRQTCPLKDTLGKERDFLLNHLVSFKLISRMKVLGWVIYLFI